MKVKNILITICCLFVASSCSYLDIIPDDVPTMDMVFDNRHNAEKMLTTCYTFVPYHASPWQNPGLSAGDEVWNSMENTAYYTNRTAFNIAKGNQNTNDPYLNYWSGGQDAYNMWVGIRDCNIMLEGIDRVPDMSMNEKARWKAEVKVLKAYFHYWMLQLYGPIPFVDESIDVSAPPETVRVYREPVDVVVEKIVALLDDAIESDALPMNIRAQETELGRLTLPAAAAIKAKVLTLAASPLFNGNPDFATEKNHEGVPLINPIEDPLKWEKAMNACLEAIDIAHEAGHRLYEFDDMLMDPISDTTHLELTLRNTITSRFNRELIWGCGNNETVTLMGIVNPPLTAYHQGQQIPWCKSMHSPTLNVAEQFYTNNGVPIDDDITWDYDNRYKTDFAPEDHFYYIEPGARTANLNFNREPRYYAYLGFDRGKWFNMEAPSDKQSFIIRNKFRETAGMSMNNYSITGFFVKKLVSYKLVMTESTHTGGTLAYSFPIIRLADLYLMYAEARNEHLEAPDEEVWGYVQKVRTKAGLDRETGSLVDTWSKYSARNKNAPLTKVGMQEIIRRERLIELSFEGHRFFDLRRWRLSMELLNKPIRGWNVSEANEEGYYQPVNIYIRKFMPRDYFWPIKLEDIYKNTNLKQSPQW